MPSSGGATTPGGDAWGPARLGRFLRDEGAATGLPLGALLALAAAIHVWVTFLAVNPWHPDEHFQILEFAWARAGLAPFDVLPWEWEARIRPTLQPALALGPLLVLRALGIESPFAWVLLLRLGMLVLAFAAMLGVLAHASRSLGRTGKQTLWLSGLLLWFTPLFLGRFTSENLGGLTLAAALLAIGDGDRRAGRDIAAGALLGLSFVFRFQMAMAIVPVLAWAALRAWQRASRMALAAGAVVAAACLVDAWFYGAWVFTPWNYLRVNLLEGMAASFGTSPWYTYLAITPLWMIPPLGTALVLLVLAGAATHRRSPWTWALVAFLAGHSLLAHKEPRFLLPLLYLVPPLLAWGVEAVPPGRLARGAAWLLVLQNTLLLALPASPALHTNKDFDAHYARFLWDVAERHPGETVYVLQDEGTPYRMIDLEVSVYRHPRVQGVPHRAGDPIPPGIPPGTPPERLLILTRGNAPPSVAGADATEPAYVAEPGFRRMARAAGMEDAAWVRRLEHWDDWTNSDMVRKVHRVRALAPSPAGEVR